MIVHNVANQFSHIELMLKSLYDHDPNYNNIVIILGYNVIHEEMKSFRKRYPNKIIITYQLEQLYRGSKWVTSANIKFLRESDFVWDYDLENIEFLRSTFAIVPEFAPLQYAPKLTRLTQLDENSHDIDVLFYGELNDKRNSIITSIRNILPNKTIIASNNIWGNELDDHIQRSKIVLNLHYFDQNRLEQARIFYLLSNHKCVVSEESNKNYYGNGILMCKASKIPQACKYLLDTGKWYEYSNKAIKTLILSNYTIKGCN